jgi:DnaK suppressor protein
MAQNVLGSSVRWRIGSSAPSTGERRYTVSNNLNLRRVRRNLQAERVRLLERIAAETEKLSQPADATPEDGDRARLIETHELQSTLLAQTQQHFDQVEAALNRLNQGTYGLCTVCSQPINPERLSALPYVATCFNCQAQQENAPGGIR